MSKEKAIRRIIDRITQDGNGTSSDIYYYMYQYKSLTELDYEEFEAAYDEIAEACFGK